MKYCHDYFLSEFPQGRIALQCHDELVFEMPARFPKKHVWALTELMEKAGADYGVKAPVDPELCFTRWDKSVKIRRP
jgi:DNA polymerase I-like protein with 3'-5' exonuclease and polymerase domains